MNTTLTATATQIHPNGDKPKLLNLNSFLRDKGPRRAPNGPNEKERLFPESFARPETASKPVVVTTFYQVPHLH
jgi:hypothetical protein